MDFIKEYIVTQGEQSTVTIEGEVPAELLEQEREAAVKQLGANIEIDGFRKGHVPEKMVVEHVGEQRLLSEMAERALSKVYPETLQLHDIDAVGQPQVTITKLAADNPLGFKITVATLPDITLPDYKALAQETNTNKPSVEVTDADVEQQISEIMRQKVAYERMQEKAAAQSETAAEADGENDVTDLPTPESEAAKQVEEEEVDPENLPLPELTDEYVQTLGQPGQFSDVADFKAKLREHLAIEKQNEASAKHRATITDTIIEATQMELPDVMVESELQQMLAQMQDDLERANLKMDDYLAHIQKSKDELIAEWRPAAEKRAKLQLVLNEIAKAEQITPDEGELNERVNQILEQHPDADPARVRVYASSVLANEAVMKMLEEV